MPSLKNLIKKIIPKGLLNIYHGIWSYAYALRYGFPSRKMVVIGVTGTNGKSTTVNLIAAALRSCGEKVVFASTVNFGVGDEERLNSLKMTMPGHGFLQKLLHRAAQEGCTYAVLEVSSEGLVQNRHWAIDFDIAVFTNLTPEHIESHGDFESYRAAKKILFDSLAHSFVKTIGGQRVPKVIVANSDDPHAPYYLHSYADIKVGYGLVESTLIPHIVHAHNVRYSSQGTSFQAIGQSFSLQLKGRFDVYNALAAIAVSKALGLPMDKVVAGLGALPGVPGRMEFIQHEPYLVLVDYAPEPESLRQAYATIMGWEVQGNIIHVLGSTGGGRDIARRPILGDLAGTNADIVIVTNEDPYEDDPNEIIAAVAEGAHAAGKEYDRNLYTISDRREAIALSLSLAQPGDLVLVTGKGAEQKMAIKGGYIDWDDRQVLREELMKLKQATGSEN